MKKESPRVWGKLAGFFIGNRQLGLVVILAMFFWGGLSFVLTPKQYNPKIVAPAFNVITEFPGANAEEVYELITRPMEDRLSELSKVDKIFSQSRFGGVSVVTVQYFIGEDLTQAKIDLMQKLESNRHLKPAGAKDPLVQTIDPEAVPILVLAITSDQYENVSLRLIGQSLGDELRTVKGVASTFVRGGATRQLRVELSADELIARKITPEQVIQKIQRANEGIFIGELEGDRQSLSVNVQTAIEGVEDLKKIIIFGEGDSLVYLEDVATVVYDEGEIESVVKFKNQENERNAVYLAISKLEESNSETVSRAVLKKLSSLRERTEYDGIDWQVVRDDGEVAGREVRNLTSNLFLSIAIVSLVLILFLGLKSALIVALAIPMSLAIVFGVGHLMGQSINRITLFALILSLGLLVDNATVVIENIFRLSKKAKNENELQQKIIEAVDEVGGGLFMSTLTTILAFYPMAFVTGMMGPYMGPIPFFVPVALVASFVIALIFNPFMAFLLIRRQIDRPKKITKSLFSSLVDRSKEFYGKALKKLLDSRVLAKRVLIGAVFLLILSLSLPLFQIVKFRMLPKADKDHFYLYIDLPENYLIEETEVRSQQIIDFFSQKPEVKSVQSYMGEAPVVDFNGLFMGSEGRTGQYQATLKVNLNDSKKRKDTSEKIVLNYRQQLADFLIDQPEIKTKFVEDPPGPPVRSTFFVKVKSEDLGLAEDQALKLESKLREIKGVVDIKNSFVQAGAARVYEVDKEKASRLGVSSAQIYQQLALFFNEIKVGIFHEKQTEDLQRFEREFITLAFAEKDKGREVDLLKTVVLNNQGQAVPFGSLVRTVDDSIRDEILTDEREKVVYLSAEMSGRSVAYAMIDFILKLKDYQPTSQSTLKEWSLVRFDYQDELSGQELAVELDGEWRLTLEVFRDLGIAMAVAIFLIYLVLVAQFSSLSVPLLIMGTIPLAMIGVLPGFALLGEWLGLYFNATSMIGVIALSGIVVNNAIILLEYFNFKQNQGMKTKEALIETGKTRLLPIGLTSLTTILGSLTIISDPVWAGLAWSIIWGLSISAVLTLVIFPTLYYLVIGEGDK